MLHKRHLISWVISIILIMVLLQPAIEGADVRAQMKEEKIRVSHPPGFVIGVLDFVKAVEPYLKEFNIKMELISVRGGAENATAVASGRADFSIGSVSPVINVALQGGPLKVINAFAFEDATHRVGTVIVVRKDINDYKALKGKILATHRLGSLSDITARILLRQNGLEPDKDVTIIELPFGGMAPALKRNQVQGLAFFPPYVGEIYNEGYGYELGKTADVIPMLARECWFANTSFLENNKALTLRLMRAILLATYDLSRMSDDKYIDFISDLWKENKAILRDLSKYQMLHDRFIYDPSTLTEAVETHVKLMKDFKVIKDVPGGFTNTIVDSSIMKTAYDQLRQEKRLP